MRKRPVGQPVRAKRRFSHEVVGSHQQGGGFLRKGGGGGEGLSAGQPAEQVNSVPYTDVGTDTCIQNRSHPPACVFIPV